LKAIAISSFTPLESDILDALAWDLRDIAPDLAGQFAESLPGSRRNTGSGLFTELIVDRYRPSPLTTPTGQGESIAFDPAALMPPSPLLDLHRHTDHEPPPPVRPPLITIGPMTRVDDQRAAHQLISAISGALTPSAKRKLTGLMSGTLSPSVEPVAAEASQGEKKDLASVPISTWIAIIAGVVVVTVIFELNWFFSVFLVVVIGRLIRMPGVLPALARAARRLGQHETRPPER